MRLFFLTFCSAAIGLAVTANAQSAEDRVAQCAAETRAPGAYVLNSGGAVVPGAGGTSSGARSVSDCLLDKRAVQFGGVPTGASTTVAAAAPKGPEECKRIRNSQIATGVALTAAVVYALGGTDGAVIGGAGGTVAGIRGVNQRYRDCLAGAERSETTRGVTQIYGCTSGTPLRGGNGYCNNGG